MSFKRILKKLKTKKNKSSSTIIIVNFFPKFKSTSCIINAGEKFFGRKKNFANNLKFYQLFRMMRNFFPINEREVRERERRKKQRHRTCFLEPACYRKLKFKLQCFSGVKAKKIEFYSIWHTERKRRRKREEKISEPNMKVEKNYYSNNKL